ncbi:hypothetical protein QTP70_023718, partial [Hemibagrus guttatus]
EEDAEEPSLLRFMCAELTRGYFLEHNEAKYMERRERVYTCMRIPKELEKLMMFGCFLCLDAFLYVFTLLPLRTLLAFLRLLTIPCCGLGSSRLLQPAQVCDLLKGLIMVLCCSMMHYVDYAMMYHLIRGQSVIKLYIIYNMLEVADRLFSSFGQDILDALYWTATEPKSRKRSHIGVIPHFIMAVFYVCILVIFPERECGTVLHAILIMVQASTLNVAFNSHNKSLLTIMMSNNFVEIKGSVFKKFEKNNLFQMSNSDIKERFTNCVLLLIVCLRNMEQFSWNSDHLWVLLPDVFMVVASEVAVDIVKHAFITKFNDITADKNLAMGVTVQGLLCWSQAQINREGCVRKGIQCKTLPNLTMRIVSTNFIPDRSRPGLTTTAIGTIGLQGAGGNWATVGRRSRGERRVHRQREKRKGKSVGLRIGTLNVGTMTGKGRELADMMERRKVDILCVQETRWKGSKARSIGAGFKLFYYGVDSKRNGVGVVLKEEFVRNVLEVKRVSDRVMSLKLEIEGVMLNVVSGYAPQVGCELEEKERFWSELDEVMESIPTGERVVIGADFNGHVGEGNRGDEEVMGKFGVKERNLEGQMVVDFAKRMDMAVANTYFQKREEHRVTYKSGEEEVKDRDFDRDRETWWWNEEVQDSIQRKRLAKKKWDMDRTEENRQEYKELQHRVKREVSKAKQKAYDELYTRLDTREGQKDLYRLARQRDRDGKDVQQVYREYKASLALELVSSRQQYAYTDYSDSVARRMGFIPLPLAVLLIRVVMSSVKIQGALASVSLLLFYLGMITLKILNSIVLLGKSCHYVKEANMEEKLFDKPNTPAPKKTPRTPSQAKSPPPSDKPKAEHQSPSITSITRQPAPRTPDLLPSPPKPVVMETSEPAPESPCKAEEDGSKTPHGTELKHRAPKKDLLEIDRFTLCGNRIL